MYACACVCASVSVCVCACGCQLTLRYACTCACVCACVRVLTRCYPSQLALVLLAAQTTVEQVLQLAVGELSKVRLGERALLGPEAAAVLLEPEDEGQLSVLSCLLIGAAVMGMFLALSACSWLVSRLETRNVPATGVRVGACGRVGAAALPSVFACASVCVLSPVCACVHAFV